MLDGVVGIVNILCDGVFVKDCGDDALLATNLRFLSSCSTTSFAFPSSDNVSPSFFFGRLSSGDSGSWKIANPVLLTACRLF